MSEAVAVPTPVENVGRGTLFALLAIPAGVAVWLILWKFGFIASIVGFGVVWAAVQLYARGSGGSISRVGALLILAIVVVTLLLSFLSGMVYDAASEIGELSGLSTWEAFTHDSFWSVFWDAFPDALPSYRKDFLIAAAFGALGAFSMLRAVFQQAAQPAHTAGTHDTAE
ncbi:hypothetical protein [Aeromicrobium ginsengisoli]|uniref:DUF4199 domain-containing protein n=1 Tax=Aeromicrobium ginsengisoli TaxID=363867 RepID=A0A5M4FGL8_9ACTN|nr:hypothetical protein [Aeromicrobium ginsengisoli]KAA1399304.1 hypothetical protein ESP70_000570 [Aeromicrobium ginsengisoli]